MFHRLKPLILFVLLTSFTFSLFSQNTWGEKLQSTTNTFKQVQDDFQEEWSGKEYVKGHGWKQFHRWENFWETRLMPDGTYPDFRKAYNEYSNYMSNKSMVNGNWLPMGPFSHENTDSWSSGTGRVNVVVEDPNDPNTIYVGAPAGGIWKSTDAGSSWTPLGDQISVIGVSGIAVDPSDSDVIYIATGDSDAGDTYSIGLMKSTDGGTTWNLLQDIGQVNKILIDPNTNSTIWASGSNGLYKSTDSGATWIQKQAGNIRDMAINPGNSQMVYGLSSTACYYTTDGGDTPFSQSTGLPGNSSRMVIGVTPADNSIVYIIATAPDGGFNDVYKSTNFGVTFVGQNVQNDIFDGSTQSWYDLAIAVSDTDENTLFCGVLNIWKSTDGGSTWNAINSWSNPSGASYTHADIHYMKYYNGNFYCGSDGGIYVSTNDGSNFTDLSAGLQIGQFYKIGGSPNDVDVLSGGLQDNGGYTWNGSTWRNYYGADGMDNAVDPNNSDKLFGMIQYGGLYYSNNGGLSNINAPSSGQEGRWITPLQHDPNNNRLVVGYDDLFEYNTTTNSWNQLSTFNFNSKIKDVEIYDGNSNIIFVSNGNSLYKTTNNGTSFTEITGTLPNNITSIEVNPSDEDELWITIGGWTSNKVFHTTDGGGNWTNFSNGLPNLPTNMIKYDATNDGLYLGMDIGVYFRNDILGAWVPYNTNLPNVIVRDIEINEANNVVRIGTYGRGVWSSGTYDVPVLSLNAQLVSINDPVGTYCVNNPTPEIVVRNIGTNTITDLTINFNYDGGGNFAFTWSGSINTGMTATISLFGLPVTEGAHTYNIDIIAVNGVVDQDPSDNTGMTSFSYVDGTEVIYNLTTDCYANEISWILRDQDTQSIIDQGAQNTLTNTTTYSMQYCLSDNCYELELIDSYGDGMSSSQCDDGFYEILDEFDNPLVTMNNANYADGITHVFCLPYQSVTLGCTNPEACNYDSLAQQDDGSCTLPGCMDTTALNYNPTAGCSDDSCVYGPANDNCADAIAVSCGETVSGSTLNLPSNNIPSCGSQNGAPGLWYSIIGTGSEVTFSTCNQAQYDTKIDVFSGTCENLICHAENDDGPNCSGNSSLVSAVLDQGVQYFIYMNGWNGQTGSFNLSIACANTVTGCTNPLACNYDSNATEDDNSCILPDGCTNPLACNYDSNAQCDDNSCIIPDGCTNPLACNYDSNAQCDDNSCILPDGCTNPLACNYDSNAQCDDNSCILPDGCTNPLACNYDSNAQCDDNSCILPDGCTNPLACNYDSNAQCDDNSCILPDGCTDENATNYNQNAQCDDGSCLYEGCSPVGDLTIDYITSSSVGISWEAVSGSNGYEVRRTADNALAPTWGYAETGTFHHFNGLAPGNTYTFWVTNNCGYNWSNLTITIPYAANTLVNGTCTPSLGNINSNGEVYYYIQAQTENIYILADNCNDGGSGVFDIQISLMDKDFNLIGSIINDYGPLANEAAHFSGLTIGEQYIIRFSDTDNNQGSFQACYYNMAYPSCTSNPGYPTTFNYDVAHHTGSQGAYNYSTSWTDGVNTYNAGPQSSPYFQLDTDLNIPVGSVGNFDVTYTAHFELPIGGQIGEATNTAVVDIVQPTPCSVNVNIPASTYDSYLSDYYAYSDDGQCETSTIRDVEFGTNSAIGIYAAFMGDYWRWEFTNVSDGFESIEFDSPSSYWVLFNVGNTINAIHPGYIAPGKCYEIRVKPMYSGGIEAQPYGSARIWKTIGIASGQVGMVNPSGSGINNYIVNRSSSVQEIDVAIYPNPNDGGFFNLNVSNIDSDIISLEIIDMFGRIVQQGQVIVSDDNINQIISLNQELVSGIYTVKLIIDGKILYERLVLEK